TKAEAVNQVDGHGHVQRIDRHHLIMHLRVIDVAVRGDDVVGVHTEGHDGGVIDRAAGIDDPNERTVVLVADGARLKRSGREFLPHWTCRDETSERMYHTLVPFFICPRYSATVIVPLTR